MVMIAAPIVAALESVPERPRRVLLTPLGVPFSQAIAAGLARETSLALVCGRYEGFDERVRSYVDEEVSIGDYVLTGGEVAACVVIDAIVRLLPGVLGNADSARSESHNEGVLEYPQYTRPIEYRGARVPAVLLSGDHARIERWRRIQALRRTRDRRPDLFAKLALTAAEIEQLDREEPEP